MQLLQRTQAVLTVRLQELAREGDRGDSPIPSTVIIVGMALLAVGLVVWLGTYVLDWLNQAPTDAPEPPF